MEAEAKAIQTPHNATPYSGRVDRSFDAVLELLGGYGDTRRRLYVRIAGVVVTTYLLQFLLVVGVRRYFAKRALHVRDSQCIWDAVSGRHLATFSLENAENRFKVVSVQVRGESRPVAGETSSKVSSPTETSRNEYMVLVLRPLEVLDGHIGFSFPNDMADLVCTAKMILYRQRLFSEEPSAPALTEAIRQLEENRGVL